MKVFSEPGVLSRSERFFSTPSATARRLFYYVTRVGHYYYDARYNFLDSCDIAHLESHKNLFLTYVRSGTMYFETDQLYCAERAQDSVDALRAVKLGHVAGAQAGNDLCQLLLDA